MSCGGSSISTRGYIDSGCPTSSTSSAWSGCPTRRTAWKHCGARSATSGRRNGYTDPRGCESRPSLNRRTTRRDASMSKKGNSSHKLDSDNRRWKRLVDEEGSIKLDEPRDVARVDREFWKVSEAKGASSCDTQEKKGY